MTAPNEAQAQVILSVHESDDDIAIHADPSLTLEPNQSTVTIHQQPNQIPDQNQQANQQEEEEPECRICRDVGTPEEPLVRPCKCRGSVGLVHLSCLRRWVEIRPTSPQRPSPPSPPSSSAAAEPSLTEEASLSDPSPLAINDADETDQHSTTSSIQSDNDTNPFDSREGNALLCEVCHEPYQVRYKRHAQCTSDLYCGVGSVRIYAELCFMLATIPTLLLQASWIDTADALDLPTRVMLGVLAFAVFLLFPFTLRRLYTRWYWENSTAILSVRDDQNQNQSQNQNQNQSRVEGLIKRIPSRLLIALSILWIVAVIAALAASWVSVERNVAHRAVLILVVSAVGGVLVAWAGAVLYTRLWQRNRRRDRRAAQRRQQPMTLD